MDRLKAALLAAWISAAPFVMLHAPTRWQCLACVMGSIIGAVMYRPTLKAEGDHG